MATKTISLELDAYEKLKRAKRSDRESFSEVVRRATFPSGSGTGEAVLATLASLRAAHALAPISSLDALEHARDQDSSAPRITPSKWKDDRS